MFKRLKTVLRRAIKLKDKKIIVKIIRRKQVQEFIIDLNRIEQLLKKGEDSEGDIIGLYASTLESKSFKGVTTTKRRNERIKLLDDGDFYRSFTVIVEANGFIIRANDNKDGTKLTEAYGKQILGLTQKSKTDLARFILPLIIREVRKELFR